MVRRYRQGKCCFALGRLLSDCCCCRCNVVFADERLVVGFVLDRDVLIGDEAGLLYCGALLLRLLVGAAVWDCLC